MFIAGTPDYTKEGEKRSTGLFAGLAAQNGELRSTKAGGKNYGSVSVRAFNRADGSAAFMTLKSFHTETAELLAALRKGDRFLAAGVVESREYNGKTYTDMLVDFIVPADMLPASGASSASGSSGFAPLEDEDSDLPF